jgi:hypothetical protein
MKSILLKSVDGDLTSTPKVPCFAIH